MAERLIFRPDIHVPTDLDEGSEPQCNTKDVWQLSEHLNQQGNKCVGSNSVVYNTGLIQEDPPTTVCDFCKKTFVGD